MSEIERPITDQDLERVLAGVIPASISPETQAGMERQIRDYIAQDLREAMVTDSDLEQLTFALQHYFTSSLVPVGETVGPLAASSTGEPAMQMELSSHKLAGVAAKTTNQGIPRFQELLRVTGAQKAITATIYFRERQTLRSVRSLIPLFVYRTLADFIVLNGTTVGNLDQVPVEPWEAIYRLLTDYRAERPPFVLRIRLRLDEIRQFKLTPDLIARKLSAAVPDATFLYSSTDHPTIDVHAKLPATFEASAYITEDNALAYYLRDTLLPALRSVHLSGIERIRDAFPRQQELATLIDSWRGTEVLIDVDKADAVGVRTEDLASLLDGAGYSPVEIEHGRIVLGVEGGSIEQLNDRILQDPRVKGLNGSWYLETNGSNLPEILALPMVNSEISFCTDVTEINQVFGVQTARDYLLGEFISILSSDSYMDPRHLILLADVMTNVGLIAKVSSTGVARQKIGPLTRAGFERPVEHFLLAAAFGENEPIRGVSASIFTNKIANIGEDAFRAVTTLETVEEGQEEVATDRVIVPASELSLDEPDAVVTVVIPVKRSMTSMAPKKIEIPASLSLDAPDEVGSVSKPSIRPPLATASSSPRPPLPSVSSPPRALASSSRPPLPSRILPPAISQSSNSRPLPKRIA